MKNNETPKTPDWYDESKLVRATFADGYIGWVVDLGDGTCRFSNSPLLGENGPKWGDRVDLFYNPCDPFERPRVGYRVYPADVEPAGRNFGVNREPDEDEKAERLRADKLREQQELAALERNFEAMSAPFKVMEAERKTAAELIRYSELIAWLTEQGITVPHDLHQQPRERPDPSEEERKDMKIFLLATAISHYGDIEVTDAEVQAKAEGLRLDGQ